MRILHIHPFHKFDWQHIREKLIHVVHDPLFWMVVILALFSLFMVFFVILAPQHPEPLYSPFYPLLG